MLKVCHLLDSLDVGGLEHVAIDIASSMKGVESHIWCLKYKGAMAERAEKNGIKVREFGFSGALKLNSIFKLAGAIRKEKIDIVHSHGLYPSIWAAFTSVFSGVPKTILHCHSVYYDISRMNVLKLRLAGLFATKIIAVSEAVRDCLVKFIRLDPDKVVVVYNGISGYRAQDPVSKDNARKKLGLDKDAFVIGHVGRLVRFKGQRFIIEAAAKCRDEYPIFRWMIAGEGPERESLEREIKRLNLEGTLTLLGQRDDVEDMLHAMDIFVNPSVIKEGLPLGLIEAASAGLPLVASNIGGNSEVVADGRNGFIVRPEDTEKIVERILYLYKNAQVRRRMASSSRDIWQEKFRLDEMIRKVKAVYEES
jgi:L-malate glycosyltransferase